jgi:hypothetical protein
MISHPNEYAPIATVSEQFSGLLPSFFPTAASASDGCVCYFFRNSTRYSAASIPR